MADLREDQAFGFAPIFFEGGDHAAGLVHGHAAVFFAMDDERGRGDGFSKVEGREATGSRAKSSAGIRGAEKRLAVSSQPLITQNVR
jgi:hypothetical protein